MFDTEKDEKSRLIKKSGLNIWLNVKKFYIYSLQAINLSIRRFHLGVKALFFVPFTSLLRLIFP